MDFLKLVYIFIFLSHITPAAKRNEVLETARLKIFNLSSFPRKENLFCGFTQKLNRVPKAGVKSAKMQNNGDDCEGRLRPDPASFSLVYF